MKTTILHLFVLVVLAGSASAQYRVEGGLVSSGYSSTSVQAGFGSVGAVAQPYVTNPDTTGSFRSGLGPISQQLASTSEITRLTLPDLVQQVGDTFNIEVEYAAPCTFFLNGTTRRWRMQLTFNRSILEPLVYQSIVDDGETYTITLEGQTDETGGILTRVPFLARLGNDSTTSMTVTSFAWIDVPRQQVTSVPGSVTLKGLCATYGRTRFVQSVSRPIVHIAPNPVQGSVVSIQVYSENERVGSVVITDMHGNHVRTYENVPTSTAWPMSELDLGIVPSGTYMVTFVAPRGVGRATMIKLP